MGLPKHLSAELIDNAPLYGGVGRFRFRLSEPIKLFPGQFLNLRFPGDERYHAFSIASSPKDRSEIELFIKKVHDFTQRLFLSPEGTVLECMAPLGQFLKEGFESRDDLVFIAGGVGVTPFLSALRWARDFNVDRRLWLFLSNRTRERIINEGELRALNRLPNINVIFSLTREDPEGWDGEHGYFTKELLLKHLGSLEGKTFFTCGPGRMVDTITAMLAEAGVPAAHIKKESWG